MPIRFSSLLIAVLALGAAPAQARVIRQFSELLHGRLEDMTRAMDACTLDQSETDWDFDLIYVDIWPYANVGVGSVLQAQVAPELLLVWARGSVD
jgi:hypothetical protein